MGTASKLEPESGQNSVGCITTGHCCLLRLRPLSHTHIRRPPRNKQPARSQRDNKSLRADNLMMQPMISFLMEEALPAGQLEIGASPARFRANKQTLAF